MKIVIALSNNTDRGDDNNAKGVHNAISKKANDCLERELVISDTAINDFISEVETSSLDNEFIICAAGINKLPTLSKLKQELGNRIYIIWSAHQIPEDLSEHAPSLDLINLPNHIVDESIKDLYTSKLITTIGVPHNLTLDNLNAEYLKLRERIEYLAETKNLVIMLAGDAELPNPMDGHLPFTQAGAIKLANFVIEYARSNDFNHIVVTNGPRTGRHTGNGHNDTEPTDEITQIFLDTLSQSSFAIQTSLFDFKKLSAGGVDSANKGLVGSVAHNHGNGSKLFMAGESTSMISECLLLPHGSMVIYDNESMNPDHFLFVEQVSNTRYYGRISNDANGEYYVTEANITTGPRERRGDVTSTLQALTLNAADVVADQYIQNRITNLDKSRQTATEKICR